MKVTNTHLRIAILCLAGILILYGLLRLVLKISLGPVLEQYLAPGVMVAACVLFIWNRQIWKAEEKKRLEEEEAKKKEEEEASSSDTESDKKED